jgi:outer membrane protein assembly factor BamA
MEYEFKLFWAFLGAVFLDASNIWTLKYDRDRPGSQFHWNSKITDKSDGVPFYREFGVGYGFGVRADFDFFLIRFDLGYKLFSPYEVDYLDDGVTRTSRFMYEEVRKFPAGGEPQIAIGRKF